MNEIVTQGYWTRLPKLEIHGTPYVVHTFNVPEPSSVFEINSTEEDLEREIIRAKVRRKTVTAT